MEICLTAMKWLHPPSSSSCCTGAPVPPLTSSCQRGRRWPCTRPWQRGVRRACTNWSISIFHYVIFHYVIFHDILFHDIIFHDVTFPYAIKDTYPFRYTIDIHKININKKDSVLLWSPGTDQRWVNFILECSSIADNVQNWYSWIKNKYIRMFKNSR